MVALASLSALSKTRFRIFPAVLKLVNAEVPEMITASIIPSTLILFRVVLVAIISLVTLAMVGELLTFPVTLSVSRMVCVLASKFVVLPCSTMVMLLALFVVAKLVSTPDLKLRVSAFCPSNIPAKVSLEKFSVVASVKVRVPVTLVDNSGILTASLSISAVPSNPVNLFRFNVAESSIVVAPTAVKFGILMTTVSSVPKICKVPIISSVAISIVSALGALMYKEAKSSVCPKSISVAMAKVADTTYAVPKCTVVALGRLIVPTEGPKKLSPIVTPLRSREVMPRIDYHVIVNISQNGKANIPRIIDYQIFTNAKQFW